MNFVKKIPSLPSTLSFESIPFGKGALLLGSLAFGQWFLGEVAHIPGGELGVLAFGLGFFWLFKTETVKFDAPSTVKGWTSRCNEVLDHFDTLDENEDYLVDRESRIKSLNQILDRSIPQKIAFTSTTGVDLPNESQVELALANQALDLSFKASLPIRNDSWVLPDELVEQDLLVYVLPLPLRAADLLWIEKLPADQPSWIMVSWKDSTSWSEQYKDLKAQLPERWSSRVLRWAGSTQDMKTVLNPIRRILDQSNTNIDITKQRLLSRLHSSWQNDLEKLRRDKFRVIQNRSQWMVAGAVFASPLPTSDLLSVAVVNGLMVKEMANIWSCKADPELLRHVAKQLATAAVAQGVVEWSGQALLGFTKLHGSSWLAAGSIQALSAAYLTRVVGRSMSDWMALNNGVSEPDLQLLKEQTVKLVSNAADKEKLDWVGFLNQGKNWLEDQVKESGLKGIILEA
tara:strand:+ start:34150 stop:35523 length:1374 start_codon:yes stop_codon:yes gene_type:complete